MATKKKQSKADVAAWVPSSSLGAAIVAGDLAAVETVLDDVGRAAWPTLRKEASGALAHVSQGEWGQLPGTDNSYGFITPFSKEQREAATRAVLVVGSANEAADALHHKDIDETLAALVRFRPAHLPELAAVLVEGRWPNSDLAQRLITAGLSTRPTSEAYVLALIQWSRHVWHRQRKGEAITFYELVRSDPGLIKEGVLLRLFEIEGTREVSLGIHDKYGKDDSWADVLLRLVADGHLDRAVVIDKCLEAIERDWPQFRTSWYLGFLDGLALSDDERRAHAERFLGLLGSRIPPTVTVALDAVIALADRGAVVPTTTLAALSPVVTGRGKGQVKNALKLAQRLRRAQAADDDVRDAVHQLALDAFINDDAELQALALDLLEGPRSTAIDEALPATLELVVPRLRARFAALSGQPLSMTTTSTSTSTSTTATMSVARVDPLGDDRRVATVAFDDLVGVVARAVEDDSDPAVVEQALAGLIAHAPAIAAAPKAWAALKKRAPKIHRVIGGALAQLLVAILDDSAAETSDVKGIVNSDALFVARTRELRLRARGLVPLATPTHRDGLIAAQTLVERVAAHVAAGVDVGMLVVEGQLALFRLAPVALDDALRTAIGGLPASNFVTALRVAVGVDDVDERFISTSTFALAAWWRRHGPWSLSAPPSFTYKLIRREQAPDYVDLVVDRTPLRVKPPARALSLIDMPREQYGYGFVAGDLASVRWALTIWPVAVEALFIDPIHAVASNVNWGEAAWHQRAFFEALQQPLVTCTSSSSLATAMLVLALSGKDTGQTAVGVDALVKGLADGRVDVDAVGAACSTFLDEGIVRAKRLAAALKSASDVDPVRVRHLVERALAGDPARAPREIAAMLSLLVHLRVEVAEPLAPATRAYVQGLAGGGQVAKDRKLLLA